MVSADHKIFGDQMVAYANGFLFRTFENAQLN